MRIGKSLFDKVVYPLDVEGVVHFPGLGLFLPGVVVYREEERVGEEGVEFLGVELLEVIVGLLEAEVSLLLAEEQHVCVVVFGLEVAAIA